MRCTAFLSTAVAVFFLTGCAKSGETADTPGAKAGEASADAPDHSADEAKLKAIAAKWFDLHKKGDVDGVASLYTEDAQVLPPNAPAVVGRTDIRRFMVLDIGAVRKGSLRDSPGEITGVGVSGDLGWISGVWNVADESGKHVSTGKYTMVVKRAGSDWLIVRDIWNGDLPPEA